MKKIKNIFAFLMFVLAVGAAHEVSAQISDKAAVEKPSLVVVSAPKPGYPVEAVISGVEGDAQVDVKINSQGAVTKVEFVGGSDLFAKSVLEYAEKWKFNQVDTGAKFRSARLTFTFTKNDGAKLPLDDTRYKYHTMIHVNTVADCFDGCGGIDNP